MYRVKILSKAERQLKKLTKKNKPLARAFQKCINEISENPIREAKVGDIQGLWGHGFNFNKVVYRVAYIIDEEQLYIFIIGVGTQEKTNQSCHFSSGKSLPSKFDNSFKFEG